MSNLYVEVLRIDDVRPHPNADRLDVVRINGAEVCVTKGKFKIGQGCVYFPPGILIPGEVADRLGVTKFLKHAIYPGDEKPTQCRVSAARLRGFPSYGFVISMMEFPGESRDAYPIYSNVGKLFGAQQYVPPVKFQAGDAAPDHESFHRYTDIENYWRHPEAIAHDVPVRITEKIHGTNCRIGVIHVGCGNFEYMAGSHNVNLKEYDTHGRRSKYWEPINDPGMLKLLAFLSDGGDCNHNVVVFGELYGSCSGQDLDYGVRSDDYGFRVFDISVDGRYLDYEHLQDVCDFFGVTLVPVLYRGPMGDDVVQEFTYGPTLLASQDRLRSKFKDREGCVITPLTERYSNHLGGRMILKSVSADYLDRKGAKDEA